MKNKRPDRFLGQLSGGAAAPDEAADEPKKGESTAGKGKLKIKARAKRAVTADSAAVSAPLSEGEEGGGAAAPMESADESNEVESTARASTDVAKLKETKDGAKGKPKPKKSGAKRPAGKHEAPSAAPAVAGAQESGAPDAGALVALAPPEAPSTPPPKSRARDGRLQQQQQHQELQQQVAGGLITPPRFDDSE